MFFTIKGSIGCKEDEHNRAVIICCRGVFVVMFIYMYLDKSESIRCYHTNIEVFYFPFIELHVQTNMD